MLRLSAYFDESGHSQDESGEFVGMAGLVSDAESWGIFETEWRQILHEYSIEHGFHATEFFAFRGEFEKWSPYLAADEAERQRRKSERELFFRRLLVAILRTRATPVGAIVSLSAFQSLSQRQRTDFLDPYYLAFQTCTRGAAIQGIGLSDAEQVRMVYAFNSEFGAIKSGEPFSANQAGRAEQLWYAIKEETVFGQGMGSYDSKSAKELVPLQASDLLVYELRKEFENIVHRPTDAMRFGLRALLGLVPGRLPLIAFFDRHELLRLVVESEFQCQEGTEELSDLQMPIAIARMWQWLEERARKNQPTIETLDEC